MQHVMSSACSTSCQTSVSVSDRQQQALLSVEGGNFSICMNLSGFNVRMGRCLETHMWPRRKPARLSWTAWIQASCTTCGSTMRRSPHRHASHCPCHAHGQGMDENLSCACRFDGMASLVKVRYGARSSGTDSALAHLPDMPTVSGVGACKHGYKVHTGLNNVCIDLGCRQLRRRDVCSLGRPGNSSDQLHTLRAECGPRRVQLPCASACSRRHSR